MGAFPGHKYGEGVDGAFEAVVGCDHLSVLQMFEPEVEMLGGRKARIAHLTDLFAGIDLGTVFHEYLAQMP